MRTPTGLLVVRRFPLRKETRSAAYGGFDGRPWPESDESPFATDTGLAPITSYDTVERYVEELADKEVDVVLLAEPTVTAWDGWTYRGIDTGWYDSSSRFSLLLNEVDESIFPELAAFGDQLNAFRLATSVALCEEIIATHKFLERSGRSVERAIEMGKHLMCVAIFGRSEA